MFSCKTLEQRWQLGTILLCIAGFGGDQASPYGTGKKMAPPLVRDLVGHKSELQNQYAVSVLGLQELEAGNLPAALFLLQEAAGGFCSKNILAQIYTCLGCCAQQMVNTAKRGKAAVRWEVSGSQCLCVDRGLSGREGIEQKLPL